MPFERTDPSDDILKEAGTPSAVNHDLCWQSSSTVWTSLLQHNARAECLMRGSWQQHSLERSQLTMIKYVIQAASEGLSNEVAKHSACADPE